MPKEVDHDERRRELLEAVWRVIVRDGIEGTTIRGIAKETGWSTGVLSHYFADKDEIISSALGLAYERIATRWDEKLEGLAGSSALYELVLDNLPLDEERQLETQLLMNYWSMMIRGHDLTDRPRRRGPLLIDLLTRYVREGQEAGEIRRDEAPEDVAERLLGLIDGFSLHALLSPQRLSNERQVALIDEEFERLREGAAVTNTRKTTSDANRRRRTYA
ncbi:MAG TPA: TetR/AcrR family transcriptional regulator [Solirubrobacteraceae bacterium]|nr:TetR/AcrR family transcriptional regulator [Solirubrobacteraceae bacterium]